MTPSEPTSMAKGSPKMHDTIQLQHDEVIKPLRFCPEAGDSSDVRFPLARSMDGVVPSALLQMLVRARRPEVISFAIGMPANELFPVEPFSEACTRVLATDPTALQYGVPHGGLKTRIVELMARRGVECREEQIFLTTGSQQAMDLLGRLLLDPGGCYLMEDKVFDGLRTAVRTHAAEVLTIPSRAGEGMDVDAVEEILNRGARPAFLYTVPEGHNPLGISLNQKRRERLLEIAARYELPILEDDAYGFLSYDKEPLACLRAADDERVFYLGSFSKIFAPALRVGWIVTPESLVPRLSALKHSADIDTASFAQRALAACLERFDLDAHIETIRTVYHRRRDAVVSALAERFPDGRAGSGTIRWHRPESGFYVWIEVEPPIDTLHLLETALDYEDVAFTPGGVFALDDHADNCLRLSFVGLSCERIREGIDRLGKTLERF